MNVHQEIIFESIDCHNDMLKIVKANKDVNSSQNSNDEGMTLQAIFDKYENVEETIEDLKWKS